jgi:hypothetical protein
MNALSPLVTLGRSMMNHQHSSPNCISVDTPQDQPNPKLHIVKRTLNHRREKYQIALAMVIHCENELDIDPDATVDTRQPNVS